MALRCSQEVMPVKVILLLNHFTDDMMSGNRTKKHNKFDSCWVMVVPAALPLAERHMLNYILYIIFISDVTFGLKWHHLLLDVSYLWLTPLLRFTYCFCFTPLLLSNSLFCTLR